MLAELAEYLLTPRHPLARRSGILREAVAIRARYARLREAWRPHLDNCRACVLEAARLAPVRGTALILGSGALLDIPLEDLAARFGQVVLADMVHPWPARFRARGLANVQLMEADLTGLIHDALAGRLPGHPASVPFRALRPDLTVSANVLSQLPLFPVRLLEKAGHPREALTALARRIVEEHLAWLESLPGVALLITDTAWRTDTDVEDPLCGVATPPPLRTWTWNIAPRPEVWPDMDVAHDVAACLMGR
jgi:hypothetical protein